jgi:hypothetical protein
MTDKLDELDRLAAEKVMGWGKRLISNTDRHPGDVALRPEQWTWRTESLLLDVENWQPTRDIAQAWECLQKMEGSYNVTWNHLHKNWFCSLWDKSHTAEAPTAPEAIVRACLKAKGVEL